ncbi:MAG: T9SS type A sorting domain-containing protein, partial [Fidelibacterota bacterium]
ISYSDTVVRESDLVTITATFTDPDIVAPEISINYVDALVTDSLEATENPLVWMYDAEIPAGNDGPVTVSIVASDEAGNPLTAENTSGRQILYVDNQPPGYVLTYSDSVAKAGDVVAITAIFQEPVVPIPSYSVDFAGDDADFVDFQMFRGASDSIWTAPVNIPRGNDGYAVVTVTAVDRIGNPAFPISGTHNLQVDNTPLVVTPVMPDTGDFVRTLAISYTLDERADSGWVTWTWEENPGVMDTASPHVVPLSGDKLDAGTHAGLLPDLPQLVQGAAYTITISTIDNVGNTGTGSIPNVTYDTLAPGIASVIVSDGAGKDIDSSRSRFSLQGHWGGFDEPVSGILLYEYAFGTAPDTDDVVVWTPHGTDTSVVVEDLELDLKSTYYLSVRATDGAGNVSDPVSSDGVIVLDRPKITTSVVQNSLLAAFAQIFIVDSLGMADSIHLFVDGSKVNLTEIDLFTYETTYRFTTMGSHTLSVTGYSLSGDTTLAYGVGISLAKRDQSWLVGSPDGNFRVAGGPRTVSQDLYLMVADSTLIPSTRKTGGAYRLADGQFGFDQPVRVSMRPAEEEGISKAIASDQALYILRSDGMWEELPTIDDGDMVTAWADQAGTFRLGPRTIIVPLQTSLQQNYPNPFNPQTRVVFDLGFMEGPRQNTTVMIYNLLGQHVRTLYKGEMDMGRYEMLWRGVDQRGVPVASGIYFVRLVTDAGYHATKKMLLVR